MAKADGFCRNEGCSNATFSKKAVLCRPCALGAHRGRHPYAEPCPSYERGFAWHLDSTCAECGYDSALHPGGGRARLERVAIAW